MRKANVGVIGTGWWATQHHIPSLVGYEKARLVGLADPNPTKLQAAAAHYGGGPIYEDYHDLLSSGAAEGVVIAVPNALHYAIARDALDAGVHVLVEKPMALRAREAWDLVERAAKRNLHLVVGYTYHYTQHAQRARQVVQSGRIGEIVFVSGLFASMVESYFRGKPQDYADIFHFALTGPGADTYSDPKVAGGGQGHTQVTHAMGLVFWVTGCRPVEVSAFIENFDLAVDLVDAISYRLDNGAVGTMGSTGSVRPHQPSQQEFRYYGTKGILLQEIVHGQLIAYLNDGTCESAPDLRDDEIYPAHAPARCLVDLILGEGENLAPGEIGAVTVEFLEAVYRSAAEGRLVKVEELR